MSKSRKSSARSKSKSEKRGRSRSRSRSRRSKSRASSRSEKSSERKPGAEAPKNGQECGVAFQYGESGRNRKEEQVAKIIYRGIDEPDRIIFNDQGNGLELASTFVVQICFTCYLGAAMIYNWAIGTDYYSSILFLLLIETILLMGLANMMISAPCRKTRSRQAQTLLLFQFGLFFVMLSAIFTEYRPVMQTIDGKSSWFMVIFNMISVSMSAAFAHWILLLLTIAMVAANPCPYYYEDRIIIETVARRKKKVHSMVADLLKLSAVGACETNLSLGVYDEQGRTMTVGGAVVGTSCHYGSSLSIGPKEVSINSCDYAEAQLAVPKPGPPPKVETHLIGVESVLFNDCKQQLEKIDPAIL